MTAVDWARWLTCPVCDAKPGEPCATLTGVGADGNPVHFPADQPHGGRQISKRPTPKETP